MGFSTHLLTPHCTKLHGTLGDIPVGVKLHLEQAAGHLYAVHLLRLREQGLGDIEVGEGQGVLHPDDPRALFPVAGGGRPQGQLHGGAVAGHDHRQFHRKGVGGGDAVGVGLFKVDLPVQPVCGDVRAAQAAEVAVGLVRQVKDGDALEEGADIVIGSRFLTVRKPKSLRMLGVHQTPYHRPGKRRMVLEPARRRYRQH